MLQTAKISSIPHQNRNFFFLQRTKPNTQFAGEEVPKQGTEIAPLKLQKNTNLQGPEAYQLQSIISSIEMNVHICRVERERECRLEKEK